MTACKERLIIEKLKVSGGRVHNGKFNFSNKPPFEIFISFNMPLLDGRSRQLFEQENKVILGLYIYLELVC